MQEKKEVLRSFPPISTTEQSLKEKVTCITLITIIMNITIPGKIEQEEEKGGEGHGLNPKLQPRSWDTMLP